MKLEMNGKASSGKCTRHLNIRYFFLTDQIEQGKVSIKYCPTDAMTSDYMMKPLQGCKFNQFRNEIMNLPNLAKTEKGNKVAQSAKARA